MAVTPVGSTTGPLRHLTEARRLPNISPMDQELQELGERVARMLSLARRLADENASLREQLAAAQVTNTQLQERICEARSRVEAALSRLPVAAALDATRSPDSPTP